MSGRLYAWRAHCRCLLGTSVRHTAEQAVEIRTQLATLYRKYSYGMSHSFLVLWLQDALCRARLTSCTLQRQTMSTLTVGILADPHHSWNHRFTLANASQPYHSGVAQKGSRGPAQPNHPLMNQLLTPYAHIDISVAADVRFGSQPRDSPDRLSSISIYQYAGR